MKRRTAAVLALPAAGLPLMAADGVDLARRAEELKNLKWGMFIC